MTQQRKEYEAWKQVDKELGLLGIEISKEPKLAKAINDWADKKHQLELEK